MAEAASGSAVVQAMIGLAAIVLGILSLSGFAAVDLLLIALLAAGVHFVVNGSTFGSLMISVFRT